MKEIRKARLVDAYNTTSGIWRLRFAGAVHGLRFDRRKELSRMADETKLLFAELREETAFSFISHCLVMLLTQVLLFTALPRAIPEVTDRLLVDTRIPNFVRFVEQLYRRWPTAFPDEAKRIEAEYGPMPLLRPSQGEMPATPAERRPTFRVLRKDDQKNG